MRFWKTVAVFAAALTIAASGATAQETVSADAGSASAESLPTPYLSLGLAGIYESPSSDPLVPLASPSMKATLSFGLDSKFFDIIGTMSANSDGKISPESANLSGGNFGNIYILMEEGGIESDLGPVKLRAGRLRHFDVIDSPYSLFVNSRGLSSMMAEISYEDDLFFYYSRWIGLNLNSEMQTPAWSTAHGYSGYPDRGANVKAFGLKMGEMRFGFQDAAVYSTKYFDAEYFLVPLPQYFIQYSKTTMGRPWYTGGNENNIIGLFWEWDRPGKFSANAQFLMDDFNVYVLGIGNWNPWKAAATAGGRVETELGNFGLYVAGATQFTFEPIGMDAGKEYESAYGYTYYPDTMFDLSKSGAGDYVAIAIEDNEIGYKYGENNLAVQADWKGKAAGFDLGAALEFRLSGSNSPSNPWAWWHTYPDGGTRWLADDVLEKRFLLGFQASRAFGNFKATLSVAGGAAIDALALKKVPSAEYETPVEENIYIYMPQDGVVEPIFRVALGVVYHWRMR